MDNISSQDEQVKEQARTILANDDKEEVDYAVHQLVLNTIKHGVSSENDFNHR